MRKLLIVPCLVLAFSIVFIGAAYANGQNPCEHQYKKFIYNECSPHTVDTDTDTIHHDHLDDPLGVGADVLIHETEHVDLVGEYKYDFENETHSAFAVFRTKTSLVDIIKGLLNKE